MNRRSYAVTLSNISIHRTQMGMRSVLSRFSLTPLTMRTSGAGGFRYFSDGKGRVLSEEERAAENVYIQKMERERLEKQRLKAEKERAEKEKEQSEKKREGTQ